MKNLTPSECLISRFQSFISAGKWGEPVAQQPSVLGNIPLGGQAFSVRYQPWLWHPI